MNVKLQAVGAERETVVECRDRVLRREGAAASVREHEWTRRTKERMEHGTECTERHRARRELSPATDLTVPPDRFARNDTVFARHDRV